MSSATRPDTYFHVAAPGEQIGDTLAAMLMNVDGSKVSAPLKITHVSGVRGKDLILPQGVENAVDIDCSSNVDLQGTFGTGPVHGDQVVTVKGGSKGIRVSGTILGEPGRQNSHVQVGNWMDQDYGLTSDVTLDLIHGGPEAAIADNRPRVNVVTGWVRPFSVKLSGDCKWLALESIKLKAYILAKFAVRFVLRIPQGTKGPSWL